MAKDVYVSNNMSLPEITKKRSFFNLNHSSHLDMNCGLLYPIDKPWEVIPGDSFDAGIKMSIRMSNPPKVPTCDQLVFDLFYYYVPNRIVYDNWDQFITGDTGTDYTVLSNLTVPQIVCQNTSAQNFEFSLLDYIGFNNLKFPAVSGSTTTYFATNALPIRGYYRIWNEFFRYESLQQPVLVPTSGSTTYVDDHNFDFFKDVFVYSDYSGLQTYPYHGLSLMRTNRLPDYFSRALPAPVAGPDVKILEDIFIKNPAVSGTNGSSSTSSSIQVNNLSPYQAFNNNRLATGGSFLSSLTGSLDYGTSNSIRALSNAFALNKLLYTENIYGRRITEWTYGQFGVTVPDDRVQRPEPITRRRIYLNMSQIMQSSETGTTPQGTAGAWSYTEFRDTNLFFKSLVEFGYIHVLGTIRVLNHTYAQGTPRDYQYQTRFDYFMPPFVNVGDQDLKLHELYFNGYYGNQNEVFGYQERNKHLKVGMNYVAGHMRPQATNTLAIYTYTDYYSSRPYLSDEWIQEPIENIDRTMYLAHDVSPQFIVDCVHLVKAWRTMPYNSEPGGLTGSW